MTEVLTENTQEPSGKTSRVPFELPDSQCRRLTRNEMSSIRLVLILASEVNNATDDLREVLKVVPEGQNRLDEIAANITELFRDIRGVISDKQRRALLNSAADYDLTLVPRMSPRSVCLAVNKKDMTTLVNCAREKCKFCTFDGEEAKACPLYELLVTYIPLDDYGNDITCPYAYEDWAR